MHKLLKSFVRVRKIFNQSLDAFTLIELLVVIAIIGVLASITILSYPNYTKKARQANTLRFSDNVRGSLQQDIVAWWRFDETSGSIAKDSWWSQLHGNVYGAVWEKGIKNNALSFDGINDYVEAPSNEALNPISSNFTITVWFKLNSTGGLNGAILYNKENLYEASAGGGYFTYAWQPYWVWSGGTTFPVSVGEWYYAVVVYNNANQYVYKNGQLVYSRNQTGNIGTNSNALRIGARGAPGAAGSFFPGLIDDLAIYKEALPIAQIEQLYVEGLKTRQNLTKR